MKLQNHQPHKHPNLHKITKTNRPYFEIPTNITKLNHAEKEDNTYGELNPALASFRKQKHYLDSSQRETQTKGLHKEEKKNRTQDINKMRNFTSTYLTINLNH
jgi:hypothetical protein